jgi:hypothetical protein
MAKLGLGFMALLGLLLTGLGVLWALQGAGLITVKPVACVANCEPLEGFSATWLAVGIAAILLGIPVSWHSIRRLKRRLRPPTGPGHGIS